MAIKVDYAFYRDDFGGSLSELEFASVLPDALRHVAWMCGGRTPARCELRAYKRAVCAACEAFAEHGHGPARGYSLGKFRVSVDGDGRGASGVTGEDIASRMVEMELCTTTLLFSGVR